MLHRVKKEHDINKDKWIGIGGKFEDKESPEECLVREVREETGLTLTDYTYRGLVTFVSDRWVTEYMHLFTARTAEDPTVVCDEGTWNGWTRTRSRTCLSGGGTRSSWTCWPGRCPSSP